MRREGIRDLGAEFQLPNGQHHSASIGEGRGGGEGGGGRRQLDKGIEGVESREKGGKRSRKGGERGVKREEWEENESG